MWVLATDNDLVKI